jgi:hypothetical protein
MPMKAVPMKGRLTGKRVRGYLWAGPGEAWRKKESYFQLEDPKIVSAVFAGPLGEFWVRCNGARCELKLYGPQRQILAAETRRVKRAGEGNRMCSLLHSARVASQTLKKGPGPEEVCCL